MMRTTSPQENVAPALQREVVRSDGNMSRQVSELNLQKELWMDAVVKLLQEQLADQTKQLQGAFMEDLEGALTALMQDQLEDQERQLRRAVAEEVGALLAEGGHVRRAFRGEVEAALESWGGRVGKASPRARSSKPRRDHEEGKFVQGEQGRGTEDVVADKSEGNLNTNATRMPRSDSMRSIAQSAAADHLVNFVQKTSSDHLEMENGSQRGDETMWGVMLHRGMRLRAWLRGLEEPPHPGLLARFVDGSVVEGIVCFVVLLNFVFMAYAANVEIQSLGETDMTVLIGTWGFQAFYTCEIVLKLAVHRQWFFVNRNWKMHIADLTLVVSGFITLGAGSGGWVGILRSLRFLKFGNSVRALRLMSHLKHLRGLLLCLQGSLLNLFWTVVMLFVVYLIFSLFLIEIIVGHLEETGEALDETVFYGKFHSVESSVLTLYKASTGGDDWSLAYDAIQIAGPTGSVTFLLFVVFVQFALMNIITSIFVESAMVTLSPSPEMRAEEHAREEQVNAKLLEQMCIDVDSDCSGKLTQKQFEDGLRQNDIPMLLSMLGLQRHHVLEFFAHMADAANDDGQVEISKFVSGCMLLKGGATNFDLHQLHAELHQMHLEFQASQEGMYQFLRDRLEPSEEDPWECSLPPGQQGA